MSRTIAEHIWRDKDDLLVLAEALEDRAEHEQEFGREVNALRARYMLNQVRKQIERMTP